VNLTAAEVVEIMRLVESSHFEELSLELNGTKLNLRRGGGPVEDSPLQRPRAAALPATPAPRPAPSQQPTKPTTADPSLHEVTAPLLGTFYRAPKPGAPAFVEQGSAVESDTVIGIIEVMKLMNTVRAGVRGTVVEIFSGDGALVEFGETILRIAKSG